MSGTNSDPRPVRGTESSIDACVVQSVTWVSAPVFRSRTKIAESSMARTGTRPGCGTARRRSTDRRARTGGSAPRAPRTATTSPWSLRGTWRRRARSAIDRDAIHGPAERLENMAIFVVIRRRLVAGPARHHARDVVMTTLRRSGPRCRNQICSPSATLLDEDGSVGSRLGRDERPGHASGGLFRWAPSLRIVNR